MKRIVILLVGLAISATAHAQSSLLEWVDAHGMNPASQQPGDAPDSEPGVLTVYADRAAFNAVLPPAMQSCEDYEDTDIAPGQILGWPAPFDSNTSNAVIPLGSIAAGLTIQDNPINNTGPGSSLGLVTLGAGAFGAPSDLVIANTFVDSLDLLFDSGPTDVALDVFTYTTNDNVTVTFYDQSDAMLGDVTVAAGPSTGGFVGVSSPSPIGRASISATNEVNTGSEGGDDICFNAPDFARFLVYKSYDDGNTTPVEVTLSCNTGLPLEQSTDIAPGDPVNFVVVDYEKGTLDCEVTEVEPVGYTAGYDDGHGFSDDNCSWEDITGGQFYCEVSNSLDQVEIVVTKEWFDENPQFNMPYVADADWSCSNVAFGQSSGSLQFFTNPDDDSFLVYPDWDGGTTCDITEVSLNESGTEVDDSDCQDVVVFPGEGASCTIVNTRLFAGIPTLSQYGLAVLALLMLGVGLVGFRRFV